MNAIEDLPLFPLSDVVSLPQVSVPLYIFEPRYRQMTREALEGARRIGMVALRPSADSKRSGDPLIFEVGCVGRIAQAQQRPDGTFQILLLGERRFRILREHPRIGDRLYRSARVQLLEDAEPETHDQEARLQACRVHVLDALGRLIGRAQRQGKSVEERLAGFSTLEPARLVNVLAQVISFDPIERQQLLEASSILDRFEIMGDLLQFRLAEEGLSNAGTGSLPN